MAGVFDVWKSKEVCLLSDDIIVSMQLCRLDSFAYVSIVLYACMLYHCNMVR